MAKSVLVVYDGGDAAFGEGVAAALKGLGEVVVPQDRRMTDADLYLLDARFNSVEAVRDVQQLGVPAAIIAAYCDDWITDLVLQGEVIGFLEPTPNPALLRIRLMDILSRL